MAKKKKIAKVTKTKAPDTKRIAAEIAALIEIKPKVRKRSSMGDNHHDAIDAQIYVLEHHCNEDDIFDRYGEDETTDVEDENFAQNVLDEALNAHRWMSDGDGSLVDDWKELVVK